MIELSLKSAILASEYTTATMDAPAAAKQTQTSLAAPSRSFLRHLFHHKDQVSKRRRLQLLWSYHHSLPQGRSYESDDSAISLPVFENVDLCVYNTFRTGDASTPLSGPMTASTVGDTMDGLTEPFKVPCYSPVNSSSYEELKLLDGEIFEPMSLVSMLDSIDTAPSLDLFQFDRLICLQGIEELNDVKRNKLIRVLSKIKDIPKDLNVDFDTSQRSASLASGVSFLAMNVPTVKGVALEVDQHGKENTIKFDEFSQLLVYNDQTKKKKGGTGEECPLLQQRLDLYKQHGTVQLATKEGPVFDVKFTALQLRRPNKSILKSKNNGNKLLERQLAQQEDGIAMEDFMDSLDAAETQRTARSRALRALRRRQIDSCGA